MEHPRRTEHAVVLDVEGNRGTVAAQSLQAGGQLLIHFDQNRRVQVPAEMLHRREDGTYYLPLSLRELSNGTVTLDYDALDRDAEGSMSEGSAEGNIVSVIPVVVEEAQVGKRTIETGRVRITKRVHTAEEVVDVPLVRQRVEVERVPVERVLAEPASPFYDGETLVIPVMEEVFVVEKRLLLREEVRVTTMREESHHQETVALRREEVTVARQETQPGAEDGPSQPLAGAHPQ